MEQQRARENRRMRNGKQKKKERNDEIMQTMNKITTGRSAGRRQLFF
jgi:hypothetical protein